MYMRRIAQLSTLLTILAAPAVASAYTLTLSDYTLGDFATNAPGGGGPFLATATDTTLGDNGTLITFCIEVNEHFSYGTTYNYVENSGAVNGGVGGQTSPNYDPVSDATKWIYAQVVTGNYSGIAAFGSGAGVGSRVQEAIWFIENEVGSGAISADSLALANYATTNYSVWSGLPGYSFFALNITDNAGGLHQDQLGYRYRVGGQDVPVPEPASLMLFGTGLLVVSGRLLRRRRQ